MEARHRESAGEKEHD